MVLQLKSSATFFGTGGKWKSILISSTVLGGIIHMNRTSGCLKREMQKHGALPSFLIMQVTFLAGKGTNRTKQGWWRSKKNQLPALNISHTSVCSLYKSTTTLLSSRSTRDPKPALSPPAPGSTGTVMESEQKVQWWCTTQTAETRQHCH